MAAFCFLLAVTTTLWQCKSAVAPYGSTPPTYRLLPASSPPSNNGGWGRWLQLGQGMPVNSNPFSGSSNFYGGSHGIDFRGGGDMKIYPTNGYKDPNVGGSSGTVNMNYGGPTGEDYSNGNADHVEADPELAAAKAEMVRAEQHADKMTLECTKPAIYKNPQARSKCYAEQDKAYAVRSATREKFQTVQGRMGSGVSDDTSDTEASSEDNEDSEDNDAEFEAAQEKMEKAIEYADKIAAKCSKPRYQKNYSLRDTCYAERDQAYAARDAARDEFYAIRDGTASATPRKGLQKVPSNSNNFNVGQGSVIGNVAVFNSQPALGAVTNNNFGQTYRLKVQKNTVRGVCMERWQIGLSRLGDKMWEPFFDVKCKGTKLRRYINELGKVLVSSPDDSFCLFSTNQYSMTVIQDGTCRKFQYGNNGNKRFDYVLSSEDCEQEKKIMRDELKAEDEGVSTKINSKPTPGSTSNTEDEGVSTKVNSKPTPGSNSNTEIYNGPYYAVKLSNEIRNGGACRKEMELINKISNGVIERFTFPCSSSVLSCSDDTQEAMVGRPNDRFCAFAVKKMPKSLIVIEDGKCHKRTYLNVQISVWKFKDSECKNIKDILRQIYDKKVLGVMTGQNSADNTEIEALEDELIKKVTETPVTTTPSKKPAAQSTPGKSPVTGSALQNTNNMHGQMNGVNTNSFNINGHYNYMWSGDEFTLNSRLVQDKGQCMKEISLAWRGEEKGKTFKQPCMGNDEFRDKMNYKTFLVVGKANDKFRIFSINKNEYYYKDNGKWRKGSISGDKIQENDMSPSESAKVENTIKKWEEVFYKHNSETNKINQQQTKASNDYTAETNKISNAINAEAIKYNQNLEQISKLQQGTGKPMQSKYAEENARYQKENRRLLDVLRQANAKYQKETRPKFQQMYADENTRFYNECDNLLTQGM